MKINLEVLHQIFFNINPDCPSFNNGLCAASTAPEREVFCSPENCIMLYWLKVLTEDN